MADGSPPREGPALMLIRPDGVRCTSASDGDPVARIVDRVLIGQSYEYTVALATGTHWRARAPAETRHDIGAEVRLALAPSEALVFATSETPAAAGASETA